MEPQAVGSPVEVAGVERVERMVRGICDAFGATYEINFGVRPMPPVVSSDDEAELLRAAATEALGRDRVIAMRQPRLAADTMYHWLRKRPGVFYMVGTSGSEATSYPSHHQKFDIDPQTYPAAVAAIVMTAVRYLEQESARKGRKK